MKHTFILLGLLTLASCTASTTFAFSCPGCDTTMPDYGSSYHQQRQQQGQSYPGDGRGTPGDWWTKESNIQRDNRASAEREQAYQEQQRRGSAGHSRDTWQDNARNSGGRSQCGLYGC